MNEMKIILSILYMIEIVLCQINLCSYKNDEKIIINRNHGLFSKTQNKCICNDGYTGYDCSDRICLSGYRFSNNGNVSECSDRGRCNCETGLCECLVGYVGDSCENHICPVADGVVCGGHGLCVNEYDYEINHMRECKDSASQFTQKVINDDEAKYLKRNNICICESGYSGFDCSIKDCPYGLAGKADDKKGYYGSKNANDYTTPPPSTPSTLSDPEIASYDIVTITPLISEYLDLEIVRCNEKSDSSKTIPCRYEKIRLYPTDGKDEIRTKLKKSGIVYDISVQLFGGSAQVSTLSEADKMVLYYILDPFTYVINPTTASHYRNEKGAQLKLQQCSGYGYCDNGECKSHTITANPRMRRVLQGSDLCAANDPYLDNYGITTKNCQLSANPTSCTIQCPDGSTSTDGSPCVCETEYINGICRKRCKPADKMECNGNGKCKISGSDVKCECGVGYSGDDCKTSAVTYFPGESAEENGKCNGNGKLSEDKSYCICNVGYRGVTCNEKICPIGPITKDYRCQNVGNPPQIKFELKSLNSGDTFTVKLNGREIIKDLAITATTSTIKQFITELSSKGVKGEIVYKKNDLSAECTENELSQPITFSSGFTLQFFYYCNDELNPTDDKGTRGLSFFYGNKIISTTVKDDNGNTITTIPSINAEAGHGSLTYTTGTIECEECSNQGKCKEGICECNKNYGSSNGWNKNRKTIDIGDRGDCSYFFDYNPQT